MLCRTLRSARAPLQRTPNPPPLGVPRRATRAPLLPCACAPPCPTTRAPHAPRAAARAPRVPQHAARAPLVPLRVLPLRVLPKSCCALPWSRCPGSVPCSRVLSRRTRRLACVFRVGGLAVGDGRPLPGGAQRSRCPPSRGRVPHCLNIPFGARSPVLPSPTACLSS